MMSFPRGLVKNLAWLYSWDDYSRPDGELIVDVVLRISMAERMEGEMKGKTPVLEKQPTDDEA